LAVARRVEARTSTLEVRLLLKGAQARFLAGEAESAAGMLAEVERVCAQPEHTDVPGLLRALRGNAGLHARAGRSQAAVQLLTAGVELCRRRSPRGSGDTVLLLEELGIVHLGAGDRAAALASFREALRGLEALPSPTPEALQRLRQRVESMASGK
ncbi:MAG: tetratricopeptide repeat protein, partial [Planctomycetes bacterium]|nr:tetratricopeptide repeat protein [Planctomycetota bacterium]